MMHNTPPLPSSAVTATPYPHHLTIMHTTCHTAWGGLERRIFNESCWMAEHGHCIIIAAPPNTPLAEKAQNRCFEPNPWQYLPINFTNKSMGKDFFKLITHYKKRRPDVLNTHGNIDSKVALSAAKAFSLMVKKEIPCKILSRHISAHVKPTWYNKTLYGTLCDHIFTTADYTSKHLIATLNLDRNKVYTMPSGIAPMNHLPDRKIARKKLASDLGLAQDSHFIGFVGRVSPDKGVSDIVLAFLKIAHIFKHHHLVIVGDGEKEYLAKLQKIIHQDGTEHLKMPDQSTIKKTRTQSKKQDANLKDRIHFIGFHENIWPFIRAFDCKILATAKQFEGISQALLEAMFARCPVIASAYGGTPEIVRHAETGFLFKPHNSDEIADRICDVLNNETQTNRIVEQAFKNVKSKYTINTMGKRTLAIYKQTTHM